MAYVLHYAPDNASLIIRLALEMGGMAYETRLVDRSRSAQTSAAYRRLNPQGQIPALETPDGVLFETGAILLWLTDRHDALGPDAQSPHRGRYLSWMLVLANTLHPALRQTFYPEKYIAETCAPALRTGLVREMARVLDLLNDEAAAGIVLGGPTPTCLDLYLACLLRWIRIYPMDAPVGISLSSRPHLQHLCDRLDALPFVQSCAKAEGLGAHPFGHPALPNPPEGTAI